MGDLEQEYERGIYHGYWGDNMYDYNYDLTDTAWEAFQRGYKEEYYVD